MIRVTILCVTASPNKRNKKATRPPRASHLLLLSTTTPANSCQQRTRHMTSRQPCNKSIRKSTKQHWKSTKQHRPIRAHICRATYNRTITQRSSKASRPSNSHKTPLWTILKGRHQAALKKMLGMLKEQRVSKLHHK